MGRQKPATKPSVDPPPDGPERPVFIIFKDLDSDGELTIRVSDIQSFQSIDLGAGTLIHCRNGKEYRVKATSEDLAALMRMRPPK